MKNPFRHHPQDGDTLEAPRVPDHPGSLTTGTAGTAGTTEPAGTTETAGAHPWHHMQQDVDPDCERDPGSDLLASWNLEHAAAEEALEQEQEQKQDHDQGN